MEEQAHEGEEKDHEGHRGKEEEKGTDDREENSEQGEYRGPVKDRDKDGMKRKRRVEIGRRI